MDEEEKEALTRFLISFRDSLASIVEQINEFLEKSVPKKGFATKLVAPSGDLLAEVYESATEVRFELVPAHRVPTDDARVQGFLIKKVLDKFQGKGLSYRIEEEGGKVKSVVISGAATPEDVASLKRAMAWTILRVGGGERGA